MCKAVKDNLSKELQRDHYGANWGNLEAVEMRLDEKYLKIRS